MGGRGDTSKSFNENKVVSNIDASRNKPFRDKRAKELLAAAIAKPAKAPKTASKIVEKKSEFATMQATGPLQSNGIRAMERNSTTSIAHSKDNLLHVVKEGRTHSIVDAKSGYAFTSFGTKKSAMRFMNSVTKADGTVSPTLARVARYRLSDLPPEKRNKGDERALRALGKLSSRIRKDE